MRGAVPDVTMTSQRAPTPDTARRDARLMALSHEARRRMLDLARHESGCNTNQPCTFFELEITCFMVLKHLAMLERAGLAHAVRDGRDKRLDLDPTPLQRVHERPSAAAT